jgi:soluble lytic murein transglycosylase-like protein
VRNFIFSMLAALLLAGPVLAAEYRPYAPPAYAPPIDPRSIDDTVNRLAPAYGLPPALVRAVIRAESAYDPNAVSPKNAQGIMQLMPDTATRFGVLNPFDPMQNLRGGMSYLRWLFARFGGDVTKTLAAYNAGEGAVDQYGGVPPYRETQDYVAKVLRYSATDGQVPWRMAAGASRNLGGDAVKRHTVSVERTRSGVTIYRGGGAS